MAISSKGLPTLFIFQKKGVDSPFWIGKLPWDCHALRYGDFTASGRAGALKGKAFQVASVWPSTNMSIIGRQSRCVKESLRKSIPLQILQKNQDNHTQWEGDMAGGELQIGTRYQYKSTSALGYWQDGRLHFISYIKSLNRVDRS